MTSVRTNLEQYLYVTVQMVLAREDGMDDNKYLDRLDGLWSKLSLEEREFIKDFRKSQETHQSKER